MAARNRSNVGIVFATIVGLVFGAIFVTVGLWSRSATQPLDGGVVVRAEVVDMNTGTNSDGNATYTPVVDYIDPATGETHRLAGSFSSSSRPRIGSEREVSLIPGDPASAQVLGPAWFPWIFIGVGALVMIGAIVSAVKELLQRPAVGAGNARAEPVSNRAPLSSTGGNHSWTISDAQSSGQQASAVQPGYHPDPDDRDRLRYWDGSRWTDDDAPQIFET